MLRLEKFKLFNTFGFVNILVKLLSIKLTCERLLSKSNSQERLRVSTVNSHYKSVENPKTTKNKRLSINKKIKSTSKDQNLITSDNESRKTQEEWRKKQSNYLNYK